MPLHTSLRQSPGLDHTFPKPTVNLWGFPGGSLVKNLPDNEGDSGDMGSIPGMGRSPRGGNGNPLQFSYLENPWTEKPGGLQSIVWQRVRHN